jgi:hypothetical protein
MSRLATWLLVMASVALAGCAGQSVRPTKPIEMTTPAELPRYAVGDLFVFEGGYLERVVDVKGDDVVWEVAGGRLKFVTDRDILWPRKSWDTADERGELTFRADRKEGLWPLKPGKRAFTYVNNLYIDKAHSWSKQYQFDWWCRVEDPQQVTTPSGVFDTYPVRCERRSGPGRIGHTRTVYYAPELGHYVRKIDEYASTAHSPYRFVQRDLLTVVRFLGAASEAERRASELHFQKSMESLGDGDSAEWRSSSDRFGRLVRVKRTVLTSDGRHCREFEVESKDHGRSFKHGGMACREQDHWRYAVMFEAPATKVTDSKRAK